MSTKVLTLGAVTFEDSAQKPALVAKATAELRMEDASHQLASGITKETFESGDLWVTRGVGFCLNFEILFNGIPVDRTILPRFLGDLGYQICEARFWSVLSLSTVLELPSESDHSHFSVKVNKSIEPFAIASPKPQDLLRQNIGLSVPPNVHCAKLERVYIQWNFFPAKEMPRAKRRKTESLRLGSLDVMLLDRRPVLPLDIISTQRGLDEVVRSLRRLPISMGEIFDSDKTSKTGLGNGDQPISGSSGQWHSKHIADILKEWSWSNIEKPSASESEKLELMKRTGLRKEQVYRSLSYWRKKILKDLEKKDSEMLLGFSTAPMPKIHPKTESIPDLESSKNESEMLLFPDMMEPGCSDDFDMLLDTYTRSPQDKNLEMMPSNSTVTQGASYVVSSVSVRSSSAPLKRHLMDDISAGTEERKLAIGDGTITSNLADVALRALVGGRFHGQRSKCGFDMNGSFEIPLQYLAPSLFNPGFGKAMAQNSRFLPMITRSISTSILFKAQSPALREKLAKITEIAMANASSANHDANLAKGQLLSSIVQSRLWAMMHKSLFEPSNATKLLRADCSGGGWNENEDFEDLLEDQKTLNNARGEDDLNNDFDDLLEGEQGDDEFLDHIEKVDQERLGIERETEEMLFGRYKEVDDDYLLLGDGSEDDSSIL